MRIFAFVFSLITCAPAFAYANNACDDLWFVRNLVFAKQGYCFGSPLGKAIFGTSNCKTKSLTLPATDRTEIAKAKDMEQRWECSVDTNKTSLDMHSLALRRKLLVQPLHDDTESGCIGYQGAQAPLYAGHSTTSLVIGYVQQGDDFGNAHVSFADNNGWMFISVVSVDGTLRPDIGWTNKNLWEQCTHIAG